ITAYGGKENITNVDACITKLRVEVVSADKVDEKKLKELGAKGVMRISAKSVYSVFGPKADVIKNQVNDLLANMK
ncbi:MAG: glucose PTS transporter subunit EIIB, partial [bacterium]|nr:glucose PTS transporter subunit EIIB [bacterium]